MWSWDITKLKTTVKWIYLYLYVVIDVFTLYVVGWTLSTRESAALAWELVECSIECEAVPHGQLTLHADRGAPMRSRTLAELLVDLGIEDSFSRPRTSNDNPFSESPFKTTKYAPAFPGVFTGVEHGREVLTPFLEHYNHHDRHTGIGPMPPVALHRSQATAIAATRAAALQAAFECHPDRSKGRTPRPPCVPDTEYINPPPRPAKTLTPQPSIDPHAHQFRVACCLRPLTHSACSFHGILN